MRDELSLVDKFSGVWNRFINLGNQAASQATEVENANQRLSNSFSELGGLSGNFGDSYLDSIERLRDGVESGADSINNEIERLQESFEINPESVNNFAEQLEQLPEALNNLSFGEVVERVADELRGVPQALSNLSFQDISDRIYEGLEAVPDILSRAIIAIRGGGQELSDSLNTVPEVLNQAAESVNQSGEEFFEGLSTMADSTDQISSNLQQSGMEISEGIDSIREAILTGASGLQVDINAYMNALSELESSGVDLGDSINTVQEAAAIGSEALNELAGVAESVVEVDQSLIDYTIDAAEAVQSFAEEIVGGYESVQEYERAISRLETQIGKQNDKLEAAVISYQNIALAEGAASESAQKQLDSVAQLTDGLDLLIQKHEDLNNELEDFARQNPSGPINEANDAAKRAANDGFEQLIKQAAKLVLQFLSIRTALGLIKNALSENTYELKFRATFGDEYGSAAMDWVRDQAQTFGRLTSEVAEATTQFSKATTNPQNLEALNNLADRFSRFSKSGDFGQSANAINQALRTGRVRELSQQTGISTGVLEAAGVADAAKAGDVQEFIQALERAADQAGITQEAYEQMLAGPEAQLNRFTNNVKNMATQAAGTFINAFAPVFTKLNEWLESDSAAKFFNAISVFAETAGLILTVFLDIIISIANFLSDNLVPIIIVAGVAAAAWALYMLGVAIATAAANVPLLLLIGLIAAFAIGVNQAGVTAEMVFEGIGATFGILYGVIANIVIELWNLFAGFGEFFANFLNEPVASIVRLLHSLFDTVVSIVQSAAEVIDTVFGSNLAGAVQDFRGNVKDWVNDLVGEAEIQIERKDRLDLDETANKFADAFSDFGRKIDELDFNIEDQFSGGRDLGVNFDDFLGTDNLVPVNVKKSSQKISLADEDLRMLVDIAERNRIVEINNTVPSPNINVSVVSKDGDKLTGQDIADHIRIILDEEIATHTGKSYA